MRLLLRLSVKKMKLKFNCFKIAAFMLYFSNSDSFMGKNYWLPSENMTSVPITTDPFLTLPTIPTIAWKKLCETEECKAHKQWQRNQIRLLQEQQKEFTFSLTKDPQQHTILEGARVYLECPGQNRTAHKEWFINSHPIRTIFPDYDKTVKIDDDGRLKIASTLYDEHSGRWQCFYEHQFIGQVSLTILTLKQAMVLGVSRFGLMSTFGLLCTIIYLVSDAFFEYKTKSAAEKKRLDANKKAKIDDDCNIAYYEKILHDYTLEREEARQSVAKKLKCIRATSLHFTGPLIGQNIGGYQRDVVLSQPSQQQQHRKILQANYM